MGHIIHLIIKLWVFFGLLTGLLGWVLNRIMFSLTGTTNSSGSIFIFTTCLLLYPTFYLIRKMLIDRKINTIPEKEKSKKSKEDVAIKRRDKLELLIFPYLVVSAVLLGISQIDNIAFGKGGEGLIVASAIIGIYALWRFIVLFVQKRHFYCPKCKNKCKWEVTDSRIDDLTTRRKDGQRDQRYTPVTVRYYYFKYYCIDTPKALLPWKTNPTCGYIFGEWQSTYTYSERQNYYNN